MPLDSREKNEEGTVRVGWRFYTLVTCAVTAFLCTFYLYHACVTAEDVYPRKYLLNFSVSVGLFLFIFLGKLLRYYLTVTTEQSTKFILIQIDSMCLALGGFGMTLVNYYYDHSGYFSDQNLQFAAKILAAILVIAFYCTSTLNLIFQNAVWLELLCIVSLYILANIPIVYKICNDIQTVDFNYNNLILMSLCILVVIAYSSNVLDERSFEMCGLRQGCPLWDILLFETLTVFVSVTVDEFSRHQDDLLKLNSSASLWDTLGLSTLVILVMLCLNVFFENVYIANTRNNLFDSKIPTQFGTLVSNFKTFLGSDVQCVFFGSEQIIKV